MEFFEMHRTSDKKWLYSFDFYVEFKRYVVMIQKKKEENTSELSKCEDVERPTLNKKFI